MLFDMEKVQLLLVLVVTVTVPVLVADSENVTVNGMTSPAVYLPLFVVVVTELMEGGVVSKPQLRLLPGAGVCVVSACWISNPPLALESWTLTKWISNEPLAFRFH